MKACPGKTFSKVEYVAAKAYLFQCYRMPVVEETPTESE